MSGEFIDRQEFHKAIDDLKEDIQDVQKSERDERSELKKDFQEMKQAFYNGVKSSVKENEKELSEVNERLDSIESKIDRASGGFSTLKMVGAVLGSSIGTATAVIGLLYNLGAF